MLFALRPEIEFPVLAVEEKNTTYPWKHTTSHVANTGTQRHTAIFRADSLSTTAV